MRGRIRSVKPESLLDEELWDLEQDTDLPLYRAFVGLWTQADREGRFEWRPRALKAAILPYWDGDFSRVLDAFESRGFVRRYESRGGVFGVIPTFKKHQAINGKEPPSDLPEPPRETSKESSTCVRANDASDTRAQRAPGFPAGRERKGTEGSGAEPRDAHAQDSDLDELEEFPDRRRGERRQDPYPAQSLAALLHAAGEGVAGSGALAEATAEYLKIEGKLRRVDSTSHAADLLWIAAQPVAELTRVLASIAVDSWAQERLGRVSQPRHLRKHWAKYLDGPERGSGVRSAPTDRSAYAADAEDDDAERLGVA